MKNKIKRYGRDFLGLSLIALVVILFFFKLFWPVPQLIVTPDFGRSDAWHFSFATKYFLAQSLQNNRLPLWSSKLGGGFPLLAEGQIGAFFLPNFLFFRFLPPVIAYNAALLLTLVFLGWGTYLFLRVIRLSTITALFGGLTMAFSGIAVTQLTHITLLQGMTLFPPVLVATYLLAQKKSFWPAIILALLLSQQFLAGFPQASFITILFCVSFYLYTIWNSKTKTADLGRITGVLIVAAGLSAIQFLPSFEFLQNSAKPSGFLPTEADYFSYPLKHLLTLFSPFALGNPRFGTYPSFAAFDGSIFWENTGFIGIFPLVLALGSLFFKKNRWFGFFFVSLIASFLFMLGSHSPLYLLYSFWPFNLFRVPSRFIWVFIFSLLVLSSSALEIIWQKVKKMPQAKILFLIFLAINTILQIKAFARYHNFEPADKWLAKPESDVWFNHETKIFSLGSELSYNLYFLKNGWSDPKPYLFLRNLVAPDSNLIWGYENSQVYAGRPLKRQAILTSLIDGGINLNSQQATVSSITQKLLNLTGVNTILTTLKLDWRELTVHNSTTGAYGTIYEYSNPQSVKAAYLVNAGKLAATAEEAGRQMADAAFEPGKTVLLENDLGVQNLTQKGNVRLTRRSETETAVDISANPQTTILVLDDTYYPGWKADIDGISAPIYPANINFRAVVVPAGDHRVVFKYEPQSLKLGFAMSVTTLILIISAAVFLRVGAIFRIRQKKF